MNGRGAKKRDEIVVVRMTEAEVDRLERTVERMRIANPSLATDDCIDAVFAIGLAAESSTLETMARLMEHQP
jgi:hypothetical protein